MSTSLTSFTPLSLTTDRSATCATAAAATEQPSVTGAAQRALTALQLNMKHLSVSADPSRSSTPVRQGMERSASTGDVVSALDLPAVPVISAGRRQSSVAN